ncbi:hypothetical protein BXP70_28100 [Hymenobacter crusticola]|uniref:DUF998 domain-containing protein n=2 Tax=Hymenobacter crusticola TaxID=1770526 RepID=A0A243W6U5_9BACT|nr:hypothetical protein BXP70_28100 [Hymenobacter crusticola]
MTTQDPTDTNPSLISYLTLRKTIGLLGLLLPVLLVVGSMVFSTCKWPDLQSSISGYYHTIMRDLLVGILCIVAFFLFAYKGYSQVDALAGKAACVFALGVAFFPTRLDEPFTTCTIKPVFATYWVSGLLTVDAVSKIHYLSAALLFATFTFFSLVLFTKSQGEQTRQKRKRNLIYRVCGVIMALCIGLLGFYFAFLEHTRLSTYKPVFWLEALALWAFGVSWLTKGEFIFKDKG